MRRFLSAHLDFFGIITSLLCAVHCSVLPILIGFGLLKGLLWTQNELTEAIILGISLLIAISSLIYSFRSHRNFVPLGICIAGFLLFGLGHSMGSGYHALLTTAGGLCIALAHLMNIKLTRS